MKNGIHQITHAIIMENPGKYYNWTFKRQKHSLVDILKAYTTFIKKFHELRKFYT
jgi:hypothetical protein